MPLRMRRRKRETVAGFLCLFTYVWWTCVLNMFIFLSVFTLMFLYVYFTFKVFWVTDLFHSLQNLQTLAKYCKHPNKLIADIVLPKSYSKHLNYFSSELQKNKCCWVWTYLWSGVCCLCPTWSIFDLLFCKMNDRANRQLNKWCTD